jgi:hypothetical protein
MKELQEKLEDEAAQMQGKTDKEKERWVEAQKKVCRTPTQ